MTQPEPDEPTAPQIVPLVSDTLLPDNDWAWTFLASYTGQDLQGHAANLSKAHRKAGVSYRVYQTRREKDTAFRHLCEQAEDALTAAVEERYYHHITQGVERPVTARGEIIAYVTEMDSPGMRWWLERMKPEKYHLATLVEHVTPGTPGAFRFHLGEAPAELEQGDES